MLWVLTRNALLEVPQQGASNEYLQHIFLWRNKKKCPRIITKYSSLTIPLTCGVVWWQGVLPASDGRGQVSISSVSGLTVTFSIFFLPSTYLLALLSLFSLSLGDDMKSPPGLVICH